MKCPYCSQNIDIQFIKAPPDSGSSATVRTSDVGALLAEIDVDELDAAAARFVTETRERFDQYGARTKVSEKQIAWLQRIVGGSNRKDSWD